MVDLTNAISQCFEYIDGTTYSSNRNIRFTDKSCYILIPVTGDNIEIPTMAMYSLSTVVEKILNKKQNSR